jgi:hypothetical protein
VRCHPVYPADVGSIQQSKLEWTPLETSWLLLAPAFAVTNTDIRCSPVQHVESNRTAIHPYYFADSLNKKNNNYNQCFFSKKIFRGTLSLTQENFHFMIQIGKNKCSQWTQIT